MVIVVTKYKKMLKQFELFQVSLRILVRNMFLSNAFSMSEMYFHQILRLNDYIKLEK